MRDANLSIGHRRVGPDAPVYFIAEAGSNHDGKLDQAKQLIDVAAEAGADGVKFQAFKAANLYPRTAGQSEYLKDPRSIYDIIQSLEMPLEWIPTLASYCSARGVDFLCTPFDYQSAELLAPYVPAFKIASYDMTNYPLLQHVARKGKPLIVSTGTAELGEVREMVAAVEAVDNRGGLIVLQCTAKYPAPLSALNVRALARMAELGVLTGFSDHSREPLPGPLAAVAIGAVVIEKHFTLSNTLPGPDHPYAIEPDELRDLIAKIRQVESALGSGEKVVHPEEQELRAFARRTVFTTQAVAEGARLRRRDLAVLRRGVLPDGVHPREYLRLLGRPLRRSLHAEAPVNFDDVAALRLGTTDMVLRPVEKSDASRLPADWLAEVSAPASLSGADDSWYERLFLRSDRVDFAVLRGSAVPVGIASLRDIDLSVGSAQMRIELTGAAGDDDILFEKVASALLDYAFQDLELNDVHQEAPLAGSPAARCLGRFGFVRSSAMGERLATLSSAAWGSVRSSVS